MEWNGMLLRPRKFRELKRLKEPKSNSKINDSIINSNISNSSSNSNISSSRRRIEPETKLNPKFKNKLRCKLNNYLRNNLSISRQDSVLLRAINPRDFQPLQTVDLKDERLLYSKFKDSKLLSRMDSNDRRIYGTCLAIARSLVPAPWELKESVPLLDRISCHPKSKLNETEPPPMLALLLSLMEEARLLQTQSRAINGGKALESQKERRIFLELRKRRLEGRSDPASSQVCSLERIRRIERVAASVEVRMGIGTVSLEEALMTLSGKRAGVGRVLLLVNRAELESRSRIETELNSKPISNNSSLVDPMLVWSPWIRICLNRTCSPLEGLVVDLPDLEV